MAQPNILPPREALDRGQLFAVAAGAQRYLDDRNKDLSRRQVRELTMFALHRLARSDPLAAAARWDAKLRAKLSPQEQGYVWGRLALHAARRNQPQALEWYGHADAAQTQLSEEQLAWRLRAALRQGEWAEVLVSAHRMSPPQADDPAWVYWPGARHAGAGQRRRGAGRVRAHRRRTPFYARLAAEELGLALAIPPKAYAPTAEKWQQLRVRPASSVRSRCIRWASARMQRANGSGPYAAWTTNSSAAAEFARQK